MNVTGVEWRDPNPREGKPPSKRPARPTPDVDSDDDVVEIHGPEGEETTDGLDECEFNI
ncbi:MAG: hypothetical protein ABSG65_19960 [Bryobacteraceae bacterium]|jgi:hypothetical protein